MSETTQLVVDKTDDITVVRFAKETVLDARHIDSVSKEMFSLIENDGCLKMVLDLGSVVMLSSQTLGVLLQIKQKLDPLDGKLILAGIDPKLYRVFKVTSLNNVFEFFDNVELAVEHFKTEGA